ncbi:MAG TPA: LacI family DNA-binding transcriptional regulator [Terriglobales bacterium]|nr:LacI family DNA-binding transcriptional regulator [Terriglobales bacterium]
MNIKEVATKARVSTATVSRTMNGNPLVSPKTADKVWRAIRELGYYPNSHARTLVSGRSRLLGLIISDIANPFFPELVKGFEDTAIQRDYNVMVSNTGYDSTRMAIAVRRMIEHQVDGVAIMTSEIDRHLVDELSKRSVPMVFLDVGMVKKRVSNVCVDYAAGIRESIDHLHELGHRRIAFISGPMDLKSARVRRKAFQKFVEAKQLQQDSSLIVEGNHKIDGGQAAMNKLLALRRPPTAVLTSNDLSAIGALRAIHAAGLQVPGDISLIGFDDIELSQYTDPPLTTVRLSRQELGRTAFEALMNIIDGVSDSGAEFAVSTHLIVRESTSPGR